MLTKCIDSTDVEQIPAFHKSRSAKMTAPGTSETSRRDPAKRHRSEKADMRLAWRSCRRISSATLGQKAHFCDRHHIAGATAALVSASSTGTAYAVLTFDSSSRTQPRQRGASLRSYVVDWEHSGRRRYHPTTDWGMGGVGDSGGDGS
jgi:hypothetical protein